jgi:hypothetical protein
MHYAAIAGQLKSNIVSNDVRFGSISEVGQGRRHIRFRPDGDY